MTNLFPNPTFETDLSNMYTENAWGTGTGSRSTDWAQDGAYSLKMTTTDGGWIGDNINVSLGNEYVFSLYAKGAGSIRLGYREYNSGIGQLGSFVFGDFVALSGTPQQLSVPVVPVDPDVLQVFHIVHNNGTGVVWYSDWVQFEAGTVATPYPSGNPYARIRKNFELRPY
jgi:hypothetical protein